MTLRNRIVATAHSTLIAREGLPLDGDAEYWGRLARGGAAMGISGGAVVAPDSTGRAGVFGELFRPEIVPGLRLRTDAIHREGGVAVCQVLHLGRETLGELRWEHPVGASAVRSPREPTAPRPLTEDEIPSLLEAFATGAAHALDAGFDGIEIHAAHGYLHAQFLSGNSNRREDRYGGLDGGVQLLAETIGAIRTIDAEVPIGVRVSVEGEDSDLDAERICQVVERLGERAGFEYLNLTTGVRGEYVGDMATVHPPLIGNLAAVCAASPAPVIACHGFRRLEDCEGALAEGASMVGMARPFFADPDLPAKLLSGREDEIRPCVGCNQDCRVFTPSLLCTVNPDLAPPGLARRPARPLTLRAGKGRAASRIAVIGGGPAGLECTVTLAAAGAAPVLFEATTRIGGQLAAALGSPSRRGWRRLLDFYQRRLDSDSVELRLGEAPDADALADFDEIVVAVGAVEVAPEFAGVAAASSVSTALTDGPSTLPSDGAVVVIDDGFGWWQGISAVELALAAGAATVTVLTPGAGFAAALPHESRAQLLRRLRGARLEVRPLWAPESLARGRLEARHVLSGETATLPADAVIFVGERRPRQLEVELPTTAGVRVIGDALVPREVGQALAEAREAAVAVLGSG